MHPTRTRARYVYHTFTRSPYHFLIYTLSPRHQCSSMRMLIIKAHKVSSGTYSVSKNRSLLPIVSHAVPYPIMISQPPPPGGAAPPHPYDQNGPPGGPSAGPPPMNIGH